MTIYILISIKENYNVIQILLSVTQSFFPILLNHVKKLG